MSDMREILLRGSLGVGWIGLMNLISRASFTYIMIVSYETV